MTPATTSIIYAMVAYGGSILATLRSGGPAESWRSRFTLRLPWASARLQDVTDAVASRAELPTDRRVTFEAPAPLSLQAWGSIIDDRWALEERPLKGRQDSVARSCTRRADNSWRHFGVPMNEQKDGGPWLWYGVSGHGPSSTP